MRRRTFIKRTAQAGALTTIAFSIPACMSASNTYASTLGIQLWTVRNLLAEAPLKTLQAIKAAGYHQVEMMDTEQLVNLKPLVEEAGLAINSSFINWTLLTGRWDLRDEEPAAYNFESVVERAEKNGLSELVFGYMMPEERSSLDDYKRISDKLNEAGALCQSANIQLCYHNHSFEWQPMDGSNGFEVLIERLEPELVQFELDVFWSSLAGVAPLPLMERLKDRIHLLHLKDKLEGVPVIYNESAVPEEAFQPLGRGVVDLQSVIDAAPKTSVKYCFVEQDQSPDPLADIAVSQAFVAN
ncbi:MAG: sugar phosphate isomerase/epimerase [Bacteroidota bacterium]